MLKRFFIPFLLITTWMGPICPAELSGIEKDKSLSLTGEFAVWHHITLSFKGPYASQSDNSPNPFLDYRLQVIFTGPSGQKYNVPGFFDGDGKGGAEGDIWRVHFTPDEAGKWTYKVSFRKGSAIAVELDPQAGTSIAFDGLEGSFTVKEPPPNAPAFLRWGRLEYVGTHYLKFHDGPYFIKGGTDSPENFLAYAGFTNTFPGDFGIHTYSAHIKDWQEGDPDWGGGKGKGIIGALNYLSSQHVNSIYFLPMNIGGDGKDTWPFAGDIEKKGSPKNDNLHYDIAKLYQWEIVFTHAERKGILLHFLLNEAEEPNKRELDNGALGIERKLFYRELIARFGHHNALQWNISEEYDAGPLFSPNTVKEFAQYIKQLDPYNHPITVHNMQALEKTWTPFLGDERFSLTSFQWNDFVKPHYKNPADMVEKWRILTEQKGRPLPICVDELTASEDGIFLWLSPKNAEFIRKKILWPVYLSGGQIEYILEEILRTENFRRYEDMWRWTWYARKFLEENTPFWEMEPCDTLLVGEVDEQGQVFAKKGQIYAVYLPCAQPSCRLDLRQAKGIFLKRWYNPRTGCFEGREEKVRGGSYINLGSPPRELDQDWALLLKRTSR